MSSLTVSRRSFIASLSAAALPGPAVAERSGAAEASIRQEALARAAARLQTTATVMMVGAHPDDERSGMLATLRYGYGAQIVIVLATRGEGGQNAIGPERGLALGALRTREMEEAARLLDASVEWLADGPADAFADFGYSRSTQDTLERWGGTRLVERLAAAIRRHRPDVLIGAFPDADGQHAHHRAVVAAARDAARLAAREASVLDGFPAWQVRYLFEPVAPAQALPGDLLIESGANDPVSGLSFAQLGERSRVMHRSQNQGVANPSPPTRWALRPRTRETGISGFGAIASQLSFGGLAATAPPPLARQMREAEALILALPSQLGDREASLKSAVRLGRRLRRLEAECPATQQPELLHRFRGARRALDGLMHLLGGTEPQAGLDRSVLRPGDSAKLMVATGVPRTRLAAVRVRPGIEAVVSGTDSADVRVLPAAPFTSAFPRRFDRLGGNGEIAAEVELRIGGYAARAFTDLEPRPEVLPPESVRFDVPALIFNLAAGSAPKSVTLAGTGSGEALDLAGSPGWRVVAGDGSGVYQIFPPKRPAAGLLTAQVNGRTAHEVTRIAYPHVGQFHLVTDAQIPVRSVDAALPAGASVCCLTRDGQLGRWLRELGLAAAQAATIPPLGRRFTTVIAASDAFDGDGDPRSPELSGWVHGGGHLVILAQRRTREGAIGIDLPLSLEVGRSRNALRVSRPDAPVTMLEPDHSLLATPNRIGAKDWEGWEQERAVGVASQWDSRFVPLIATADVGQAPTKGALLSARVGRGRITYVALALERQLDGLVPGAFRLLANLAQPA